MLKKGVNYEEDKGESAAIWSGYKGKNINFAVQVAKGKTCELLLYKRGKDVPEYQFDMPEEEGVGEVRFLSVEGLKADRYEYNFLIDGKVCVDPYVKELAGKEKFGVERKLQEHQIRGKIVSMETMTGRRSAPTSSMGRCSGFMVCMCVDLQNILLRKWCIREHFRGLLKNWII